MQGILVINKPQGFTSMDCCAIVRKATGEKRVGHTGTLDPNATGVLPICVGSATRLIEYMDFASKTYVAGFRLGHTSDTEDIWGNVTGGEPVNISREDLLSVLEKFKGEINQVPPMYSAKKINGQKLYDIARSGAVIERKPVKIQIYRCELKEFDGINGVLEIECCRGTYIRTICADIGKALGCGAIMTSLVRTKTCGYSLDDAVDLLDIKEQRKEIKLLSIDSVKLPADIYEISNDKAELLLNGNPAFEKHLAKIKENKNANGLGAVYCNGKLIAILKNEKINKVFRDNY